MDVLYSLLSNIGLLSLSATIIFLFVAKTSSPGETIERQIISGVIYGFASVLVIQFPIIGPYGSSFDTRAAPIIISGYFGGPVSGIVTAIIGSIARLEVGGPAMLGGVASFGIYLLVALGFRKNMYRAKPGFLGFVLISLTATVAVVPAFFIDQGFETGLAILESFWPVLLTGNLIGVVFFGLIVERKRQHIETEREFNAIIQSSPDGIITVDEDLKILSMNPSAVRMFGYGKHSAVGQHIDVLVPDEFVKGHAHKAEDFIRNEATVYKEMTGFRIIKGKRQNGETFPVLVSLAKYARDDKVIVAATVHNMSEIQAARTKLINMSDELAHQLQESQSANDAKNRFMANMSHELRTPLNAIIGFSSLLSSKNLGELSQDKSDEYLTDIRNSGENLLKMINDVIDISRIEEDRVSLVFEELNISSLIDYSTKLLSIAADARGTTIDVKNSNDLILGDRQTSQQVIVNVLSNAIKYSPKHSRISVHTIESDDCIGVVIEDEGDGIPLAIVERIGEPFLRGDAPEVRTVEGSGLGLALSKRFLERQGGELAFEQPDTGGTRAIIYLPKTQKP
jgi:PAS domain S-box-containing protein